MSARVTPPSSTSSDQHSLTATVKETAPCQQAIQAHLAPDGVGPVREVVLKEFQREANIAGFRKGKAPRELVERKYSGDIQDELVRRLTRQVLEQVSVDHKLRPVGPFEVSKLEYEAAKGLDIEARVEVEPAFKLGDYRGIDVKKPPVAVKPDEIDAALKQLQESSAELVPVAPDQPKEKRVPNLDDEFAKDLGFQKLDELKTHVEAKLRENKQAEQRQEIERTLCDALLERHRFEVPTGLVTKQVERLTRDFQVRMLTADYSEEQVKQELEKYSEQMKSNAERHVKLSFILDRVADQEELSVTQDEIVERLWKLARRSGKDPSEVRRLLDAQGLWPSVLSSIRQEKTINFLLGVAHVDEPQPSTMAQA